MLTANNIAGTFINLLLYALAACAVWFAWKKWKDEDGIGKWFG